MSRVKKTCPTEWACLFYVYITRNCASSFLLRLKIQVVPNRMGTFFYVYITRNCASSFLLREENTYRPAALFGNTSVKLTCANLYR